MSPSMKLMVSEMSEVLASMKRYLRSGDYGLAREERVRLVDMLDILGGFLDVKTRMETKTITFDVGGWDSGADTAFSEAHAMNYAVYQDGCLIALCRTSLDAEALMELLTKKYNGPCGERHDCGPSCPDHVPPLDSEDR